MAMLVEPYFMYLIYVSILISLFISLFYFASLYAQRRVNGKPLINWFKVMASSVYEEEDK